jgi:tRNA(Ile)-lysidine synthetase-like protein
VGLLAQVQESIEYHGLLDANDTVVVGVSGGPDSLCLLDLLLRLGATYRLQIHVAHLHHGARGAEADADADFVTEMAARLDLPVIVVQRDVPAIAEAHGLAFEEAARRVRYGFLSHVAGEVGATKIAVGHNADDQAETVLMHLLRGAGPAGLRGMLPLTPLDAYRMLEGLADFRLPSTSIPLIRPLLGVDRAAIEEYCAERGLRPRFDRSNLDTTYFRNRLRHELLPVLEAANPNVGQRLRNMAEVIAADYDLLERLRDQAWEEIVQRQTQEVIVFDRPAWDDQHLSLQRALIREAAYRLRPRLRDVSFVHIDNAVRIAREGRTGAQAILPDGLALTVGYTDLTMATEGGVPLPEGPTLLVGSELPVALPGATPLHEGGWVLQADVLDEWTTEEVDANSDRWTAYLDLDALSPPWILRARRRGDRFQPQGMGGHAPRLSDWMINAKVPRTWRNQLPLLIAGEEIVWVCGWRVAEGALVGPATRRVARFRFQRPVPPDSRQLHFL